MKSLFGSDDDDFDFFDSDAKAAEPAAPTAENKLPSAALNALFDSVLDEELAQYDERPSQTEANVAADEKLLASAPELTLEAERQREHVERELRALQLSDDFDDFESGAADAPAGSQDTDPAQKVSNSFAHLLHSMSQPTSERRESGHLAGNGATDEQELHGREKADEPAPSIAKAAFEQYLKRAQDMPSDDEPVLQPMQIVPAAQVVAREGSVIEPPSILSREDNTAPAHLHGAEPNRRPSAADLFDVERSAVATPGSEVQPAPAASPMVEEQQLQKACGSDADLFDEDMLFAEYDQAPATEVSMKISHSQMQVVTPASAPVLAPEPGSAAAAPLTIDTSSMPIMDLSRLQRICGDTGMREIIDEFVISSQRLVDELELSILNKDDDERRRLTHELTGSCSALGAKQVQEVAMAMQLVANDDWEKCNALFRQLKPLYEALKTKLLPYLR